MCSLSNAVHLTAVDCPALLSLWGEALGTTVRLGPVLVPPGDSRNKGIRAVGDKLEREERVWSGQQAAAAEAHLA